MAIQPRLPLERFVKALAEMGRMKRVTPLNRTQVRGVAGPRRGFQSPADDRPTRADHPDPFVLCPAVQLPAGAVLIEESDEAGEHVAQLAGTEFVC